MHLELFIYEYIYFITRFAIYVRMYAQILYSQSNNVLYAVYAYPKLITCWLNFSLIACVAS